MDRWTIKELKETDDITFAMCILSERREGINQEAPLAKKLRSAYHTLDCIRNRPELIQCSECSSFGSDARCNCEASPFHGLLVEDNDYCPYAERNGGHGDEY